MAIQGGFWVATEWVDLATLYSTGQKVTDFPLQDDMAGRRWLRPGDTADVISPARFVDTPTGQRFAYGGYVFEWLFRGLSPKMVNYLFVNIFGSTYSNKVTVQTWNRSTGQWEAYQCIAKFPNVTNDTSRLAGGFDNFKVTFTAYTGPLPDGS